MRSELATSSRPVNMTGADKNLVAIDCSGTGDAKIIVHYIIK